MPATGEQPGKGVYYCKKCGTRVVIEETTDTLPTCSRCNHTEFEKG